jgi:hypothetical protein
MGLNATRNLRLWMTILLVANFPDWPSSFVSAAETNSSVCNGIEGLCGFLVKEVLFGMVHNAMSSPSHGFSIFYNHENNPMVDSLDAGYRGINLDVCRCNGNLVLCHGGLEVGCGIGSRDVTETFEEIDEWLEENPQEVIIISLEVNNAGGGEPISLLDDVYPSLPSSLTAKLYQHEDGSNGWPTLGEMIQNCKQVVFFYTRGPEGNPPFGHPPGIHFFFDYASQTKFSHTSVSGLEQDACDVFRAGTEQDFFLLNNFILVNSIAPSKEAAETINTVSFVEPTIERCQASTGQSVSLVSVDFWKSGNLPELVRRHNAALVETDPSKSQTTIAPNTCRATSQTEAPSSAPSQTEAPSSGSTYHHYLIMSTLSFLILPAVALLLEQITITIIE